MDSNGFNPYSVGQDSEAQKNDVPQYTYVEGWMGSDTQQNPYAQNATQKNPYAQNAAQQNPYAQNTAQQNPYASDAYWSTPYRQVPYYQQPVGSTYMQSAANRVPGNGMVGFAITSLVCGICSILACCVPVFDLVFVVIGLILGIIAIAKKYNGQGMAAAGVICSTIGLGLNIICIVLIAIE